MHDEPSIVFSIFVIFTGAAVLATVALYARQALILGYIALGALVGPPGFGLISQPETVRQIAEIGIIFLLYLLGLNLHPQKLLAMLRDATSVTLLSGLVFGGISLAIALAFGFGWVDALVIGASGIFSSTILGLKLLPTTTLHHRHTGEIVISVLLLQDIIAIVILLLLRGLGVGDSVWWELGKLGIALPLVGGLTFVLERYVLLPLIMRFNRIQEYVFLLAIGWCLGMAQLAAWGGLTYETGAFIAGVALATNPISRFVAESLKPLRDFFLVIFFFSLGAQLEPEILRTIALPAAVLAATLLALKPLIFRWLLVAVGEESALSREIGVRLGQVSEFSLLIAVVALEAGVIGQQASYLIQATTLISFIVSSFYIVLRYPTPIATNEALRRD